MQPDSRHAAILVVDENQFVRNVVKIFLESAGYGVFLASDAEAALSMLQENGKAITLVLTDLTMPKMSGLELADQILELNEKLPIVFMSGTGVRADRGYGCVRKPFKSSDLLACVDKAMQSGQQGSRVLGASA